MCFPYYNFVDLAEEIYSFLSRKITEINIKIQDISECLSANWVSSEKFIT